MTFSPLLNTRCLALIASMLATACFNPDRSEGLECSDEGMCPDSLVCLPDNTCGTAGAPDANTPPADASSISLVLTDIRFSPGVHFDSLFSPSETQYDVNATFLANRVIINATSIDNRGEIEINGELVESGNASAAIDLVTGQNEVVIVLRENDQRVNYTLKIERQEPPFNRMVYTKASDTAAGDQFGASVAIFGDRMVVGAPNRKNTAEAGVPLSSTGAAYVLRNVNGTWIEEAVLTADAPGVGDEFGRSVAIYEGTIVVGAPRENTDVSGIHETTPQSDLEATDGGAVYVFQLEAGIWKQRAYIKAQNATAKQEFGSAVSIWADTLIVGAPSEDGASAGINAKQPGIQLPNSGAVYVFERTEQMWRQEAYIKAAQPGSNDNFGTSVSLQGQRFAVGAPKLTREGNNATGAVFTFQHTSQWRQQQLITVNTIVSDTHFGESVSLDGDYLAVGAPRPSSEIAGGAAHIYQFVEAAWVPQIQLGVSSPFGTTARNLFGQSLCLSGTFLIVGAPAQSRSNPLLLPVADVGEVFLYERNESIWSPSGNFQQERFSKGDNFGASTAIGPGLIGIGARNEDSDSTGFNADPRNDNASNSGASYIFE